MPDEDGFGHHGVRTAGTGEPGHRHQQMKKQGGHIAHRTILARSRHPEMLANLEFAMHNTGDVAAGRSGRVVLDLHFDTEVTKSAQEPFGQVFFVPLFEILATEIVKFDAVTEHVVDVGEH